jgi:hypothetical protein
MTQPHDIDMAVKLFVLQHGARLRFASKNRSWYEWDANEQWWVYRPTMRVVYHMSVSADSATDDSLQPAALSAKPSA